MTHEEGKERFLKGIAWQNSWQAAVNRNKTFRPSADSFRKQELRETVRCRGELIAKRLSNGEAVNLYQEIRQLADSISMEFSDILAGRFKIGTAQKALNLYLKFLWCLGLCPEPPHLPLDRRVQEAAKLPVKNWTEMDDIDAYREVIASLERRLPAGSSLAQWELKEGWIPT